MSTWRNKTLRTSKLSSSHAAAGESVPIAGENVSLSPEVTHANMSTWRSKTLRTSKLSSPHAATGESIPITDEDVSLSAEDTHASTSTVRKRKRGRTRNLKLIVLPPNEKLPLEFNEFSQAIGENASTFANHLGCLVRNCENCPIDVEDWEKIPEMKKENIFLRILDKFEFELTAPIKFWISQKMRKQFSVSKSKLKKKYCDCYRETETEAMIQNRPEHIPEDQWKGFIELINKSKFKDISKRNKINRAKQVIGKTTGTKSFACVRRDLVKRLGRPPGKYEFWKHTHMRKDKRTMIDSFSQNIVDQVENPKGETSSNSTTTLDEGEDDRFLRIIGPERHGRVRSYGLGPTPTTVFGGAPTCSELKGKLDEANKKNEVMQTKLNAMEQQLEATINDLEQERKRNEEERKRSEEERKKSAKERSKILDFINQMAGKKLVA